MGLRFRTSFKIAPGLRLNIGKRGVTSLRVGPRGAGISIGKRGTRMSADLPGPFSISQRIGQPAADTPTPPASAERVVLGRIIILGGLAAIGFWLFH